MNVLVDTSIWSLALRRRTHASAEAAELAQLVIESRAEIIGPIRQELLSGLAHAAQFQKLKASLASFADRPLHTSHFETAADFHNQCRRRGVQGSHTDFLICATAHMENLAIFTTDEDFLHYSKVLPIRLYQARQFH